MKSKTKVTIPQEKIKEIIQYHFEEEVISYREVISGFYNAIYYIKTVTNEYVLKVAPSKDIEILTYEIDIMKRETKVCKLLHDIHIPVPSVLVEDYTKNIIDSDYCITNYIEGSTLFELKNTLTSKDKIYFRLMEYLADIHLIEMETFGYDNFEEKTYNLQDAYLRMINNLVKDAIRVELELPNFVLELLDIIYELSHEMEYEGEPVLLHFDLWDGNIFIHNNQIVGLIDAERSLNGEPMMEFVAMHWDIFAYDKLPFIEHYNSFTNNPIILNEQSELRYRLYQVYMYLLIVVECPYRDIDGSFEQQKQWGLQELEKLHQYFINKK